MKKLIFVILSGCLLTSCSASDKDDHSNFPTECKETFIFWDTLLEKQEKSGEFSPQSMAQNLDTRKLFEKRISTETIDRTKQKNTCE